MIALKAVRTSLARIPVTAHLATFLSMTMNAQVSGYLFTRHGSFSAGILLSLYRETPVNNHFA